MRKFYRVTAASIAMLPTLILCGPAGAQTPDFAARVRTTPRGTIITPSSTLGRPGAGTAHTNVEIFVPTGRHLGDASPSGINETPASLACVYGVTPNVDDCNPVTLKTVSTGGSKMIAIVDAFDDANAQSDLAVYSKQYGLPAPTSSNFEVVYASGTKPEQDSTGGWELEESLDVQMAHAIAPNAKVVLVEAASDDTSDLLKAERVAIKMVTAAGGGEVTNSWGSGEYGAEVKLENAFSGRKVVVFASAGDSPGVIEPSALANVVSVGGTTITRTGRGKYVNQITWSAGGGGISDWVPIPSYQSAISKIVGIRRGTPDISADADPSSGPWVYDSTPYSGQKLSWVIIGGTSVASPLSAALMNEAGNFPASTTDALTSIYANLGNAKAFFDVTKGLCLNAASSRASVGYDLCTGVGAPAAMPATK